MTRPMPGPPEWYDIDWNPVWGMVWAHYPNKWDRAFSHAELDKKHLTDTECWTEYHHADAAWAKAMVQVLMGHRPMTDELNEGLHCQIDEAGTWHRFATRPHALEAAP